MQKREAPWPTSETETFSVVIPDGYTITDVVAEEGVLRFRATDSQGRVFGIEANVGYLEG